MSIGCMKGRCTCDLSKRRVFDFDLNDIIELDASTVNIEHEIEEIEVFIDQSFSANGESEELDANSSRSIYDEYEGFDWDADFFSSPVREPESVHVDSDTPSRPPVQDLVRQFNRDFDPNREVKQETQSFAPSNLPSRSVPLLALTYRDVPGCSGKKLIFDITSNTF